MKPKIRQKTGNSLSRKIIVSASMLLLYILALCALTGCSTANEKTDMENTDTDDIEDPDMETAAIEIIEDHHTIDGLCSYLMDFQAEETPNVFANITLKDFYAEQNMSTWTSRFEGEADIQWQIVHSPKQLKEQLEEAENEKSTVPAETESIETDSIETQWFFYRCRLPEDTHALTIYEAIHEKYDTEENPIMTWSGENGTMYRFSQEYEREIAVRDGWIYALVLKDFPGQMSAEPVRLLFLDLLDSISLQSSTGWFLDEENMYWIDHEERLTSSEDPIRSFVEVRGIDINWDDGGFMKYFGWLKEADYELSLSPDGPEISIHFSLLEDFLEDGYARFLLNGFCMDEYYQMRVTVKEDDRLLQQRDVALCIEIPDTIHFIDLNEDGYLDMQIDRPNHSLGQLPVMDPWATQSYMLWNPQEECFESKTANEVANSRLANLNGRTEEEQKIKSQEDRRDFFAPLAELPADADPADYIVLTGETIPYIVVPGDTLWDISERFLGTGFRYHELQRQEDAPKDPDYLLPGELILIPELIYIPKDPYSRGGLESVGSFSIEQPDGFSYFFLSDHVFFWEFEEENTIFMLPVTNEMGENALSGDEDWEAFQEEVIRCSQEICQGRVSNLQFEKYGVEGGCDLYGYSFEFDAGDKILEYTAFIRLGASNMAEVIGVREKEPNTVLLNVTRYIAASFIDYGGEPTMGFSDRGPNVGADEWNYPELHNLFTAAMAEVE